MQENDNITLIEMEQVHKVAKRLIKIEGMTCGACSSTIQRLLDKTDGIQSASVSLMMHRAQVEFFPHIIGFHDILESIEDVGFGAERMESNSGNGTSFQLIIDPTEEKKITSILYNNDLVRKVTFTKFNSRLTVSFSLDVEDDSDDNTAGTPTKDDDFTNTSITFGPRSATELLRAHDIHVTPAVEATDLKERKRQLEENQQLEAAGWWTNLVFSAKFAIPLMILHMVLIWIPACNKLLKYKLINNLNVISIISCILSTPVQYYCGHRFYIRSFQSLSNGNANMDVLIAVGTTAAYGFSWFALLYNTFSLSAHHDTTFETSASLLFVVSLGKWMETVSKSRTSEALTKLMDLQPPAARRMEGTKIIDTEVHLLQINDIIQVLRGEKIPIDGIVIDGMSSVNESLITGESMPVTKTIGSEVIGGTVNLDNTLNIRITKVGAGTVLSKIVQLVENAQSSRAPVQAVADRIAQYFVPIVFLISFVTFISWYTCERMDMVHSIHGESDFVTAFMFAISVMVISCPCALGLATPTAVMVSTGRAAELNILFKGGEVLEACGRTTCIAFDKTGTLTVGEPKVSTVVFRNGDSMVKQIWEYIFCAERESEHILGKALCEYCVECNARGHYETEDFEAKSGYGVSCKVDGHILFIGNKRWLEMNNVRGCEELDYNCSELQMQGATVIWVSVDWEVECIIGITDPIKEDARDTIKWLKKNGYHVWMITGDNYRTAKAVADKIGISDSFIRAGVDPGDKAGIVGQLQRRKIMTDGKILPDGDNHTVAFVGDGINDSPSLVKADVGIAIGSGTDVAVASAGVVLMHSNLRDVITALDLSKIALQRIYYNFIWALGYNVLMIPLAAGVAYPLWEVCLPPFVAGLCMAFSSISVVCSSLLLKRYEPPHLKSSRSWFTQSKSPKYEKLRTDSYGDSDLTSSSTLENNLLDTVSEKLEIG